MHSVITLYCPASGSARISKSGGSEYVNIGTPEETLLETYFVTLSKFNFDRAREQCVSLVLLAASLFLALYPGPEGGLVPIACACANYPKKSWGAANDYVFSPSSRA